VSYIALKMLYGDRTKYLMLLCGLAFSVMLTVQQGSIFWGLMRWSYSGITNVNAPVWVTDPNINQVEEIKPLADTAITRVRSVGAWIGRCHSTRGSCVLGWQMVTISRSRWLGWMLPRSSAGLPSLSKGGSRTYARLMRLPWISGRWTGWVDRKKCTVGLTGYGVGVGLATLFGRITAGGGRLPFIETWPLLALVFVALLGICGVASVISIRKLGKLEPAIVFRG
jgi:hypothetical protein